MNHHQLGNGLPPLSDGAAHDGDLDFVLPFDVLTARRLYTRSERTTLKAGSRLLPRGGVAHPAEPKRDVPRLAAYLRISHLQHDSVSIQRQYRFCVEEIRRLGGTYDKRTDLFHDVDVSAGKGDYRAGMEDLLARIEDDRAYDGVVIWEFPRALRNYAESLNFRNIFLQGSCELYVVTNPTLRLFGPHSAFFDLHLKSAEGETAAMSERSRSRHRYLSAMGVVRSQAMFGMKAEEAADGIPGRAAPIRRFVPDTEARVELHGRSRADMLREAFDLILEGKSARSVAIGWNKANLPSMRSDKWCGGVVRSMVLNPTAAGLAHRGRVLLAADGTELVPGSPDAPLQVSVGVVGVEEWLQLRDLFAGRKRQVRKSSEPLLRGLVRCGRCNATVYRRGDRYQCNDIRHGFLDCGSLNSMRSTRLDEFVTAAAVEALKSRDARRAAWAMNSPERRCEAEVLEDQIAGLNRQLDDIETLWLASSAKQDQDTRDRHARRRLEAESALRARKVELAALAVRSRGKQIDKLYSDDRTVEDAFLQAPRHIQVTVLHELIERVVLKPATTTKFRADRIEILWAKL